METLIGLLERTSALKITTDSVVVHDSEFWGKDSRLGLNFNSSRYSWADALRAITASPPEEVIDEDSCDNAISGFDNLCSRAEEMQAEVPAEIWTEVRTEVRT